MHCRKEFCNSYYLQVHRASKHGIFDDPAASALMMMAVEREKAERESQQAMKAAIGPNLPSAPVSVASVGSPSPPNSANSIRPVVLTSDKDRAKVHLSVL